MLTKEQSIENFKLNMDELINSNYILADKKISVVLKSISCSKLFYELFEYCVENYNYVQAKNQAIVLPTRDSLGRFNMPNDSRSIIAFVFSLLYELDSKEMDLFKLLEACFNVGDKAANFKKFTQTVLVPFRDEVLCAVQSMISDKESAPLGSVYKAEKNVLGEIETEQLIKLMDEGKVAVLQYKMDEKDKQELMALHENFIAMLYGADAERIGLAFLGYKYAVLYHKKLNANTTEIERILTKNGVLS